MEKIVKLYGEYEITLDPVSMRFSTANGQTFKSWDDATASIDAYEKRKDVESRKKLNIKALKLDGTPVLITGIHAGHGGFLSKPELAKYSSDKPVIDHPVTREIIAREMQLTRAAEAAKAELRQYRIEVSEEYGSWNQSLHGKWAEYVEQSAARALELAEKAMANVKA